MELTLGPVLFEWKREKLMQFYETVAEMAVETVYLGEMVCDKRWLGAETISEIAEKLTRAGKKVVLSSLVVVSNETELEQTRELVRLPYAVEANDMSVFNMVEAQKNRDAVEADGSRETKELRAGPHITTYNVPSVEFLQSVGVEHVTFPVELSGEAIAFNIKETGIKGEVFGHGKVPLAFSWRCYTSRAHGLDKSNCAHDCARDPDGMEISSIEGEPLFTINGTTILSAKTYSLIEFTDDMVAKGVAAIRISPQSIGTAEVVETFRARLAEEISSDEALERLLVLSRKTAGANGLCNGWWLGRAGMEYARAEVPAP
jgi:collagenase-like PrtC family protease